MSTPHVSVIMLTYNRERYLAESISSVLTQSFSDLELIIMDDGSTDRSESLIREIKDERIRYFPFNHTGMASTLRNRALDHSRGEWIAFIDSDDIWLPEKLELQLNYLKTEFQGAGFTFTDVIEFSNDGSIHRESIYKKVWQKTFKGNVFHQYIQSKFVIYPSSILFDKHCLQAIGRFNELFPWTDNEFFHRLAFNYDCVAIINPLVKIRKHSENTSSRLGQIMLAEMLHMLSTFLENHMIEKSVYNKMTAHYYYVSGILYLEAGQTKLARKAFVSCIRHDLLNVKASVRALLSLFNIPQRLKK